jgi:hypothetical protein
MKPAYDQLAAAYADDDSVVIGDADCTADGKDLCKDRGIRGYPTIKYYIGGVDNENDYRSGRDFDALNAFVQSTLK